ncbi:HAD family hydrolase [Hydrogenothermus marinus]|uniref:phosphoglycolate phosphatase n=1 Tax=Hydrogenothermus marinus TaxID=133270 RepID=A0A3M0BI12_9AQUI|nr:HAD-IA family hydrolase [Hydrogenothermus marinus]RMA97053.1 HAD superfamily phosphatase [Hydrogenothermus marinus]
MIVIFDVDGVLIDVSKSYHYSIKDTVEYFTGKEANLEELLDIKFRFNINNDWDASIAGILYVESGLLLEDFKDEFKKFSSSLEDFYKFSIVYGIKLPDYNKLVEYFENRYKIHREKEELIFPTQVLEKVKNIATRTGVITGRPFEDLDYSFKLFNLYKYFDKIITEDDIPETHLRKPSAYPLKLFFEEIEYKEPVFYIGDTNSDKQMVENFNLEENKNVNFVLRKNQHNLDINSNLKIEKPDEIFDILYNFSV